MSITEEAYRVLKMNDRGGYTIPRPKLYPFQWNWDSCFVALGFMTYDEKRAWEELDLLFQGQWSNGMVPHIIFHRESDNYSPGPDVYQVVSATGIPTSGLSQPPIASFCVRRMYEMSSDKEAAKEKVLKLLPRLFAYHKWYHDVRDPMHTGVVSILHPWESGRDNSADWDDALGRVPITNLLHYERKDLKHVAAEQRPRKEDYDRYMSLVQILREHKHDAPGHYLASPFKVGDTTVNFILARADQDLLWLMETLAPDTYESEIMTIKEWLVSSKEAMERFWDEEDGLYHCIDVMNGQRIKSNSSGGFTALLTGWVSPERTGILLEKLRRWKEETGKHVVSFDPYSPRFDPRRYWRGPVWAIVNFLIYEGLVTAGQNKMAKEVAADTYELVKRSLFAEYYNPQTGEGLGGDSFSWTAAMWLYWLKPLADELGFVDEINSELDVAGA